ncbi:MAG: tyrosine--tRNA ligase [Deltaproteobacteria bacterium]|nr:tyrosine--tRNA ligase [Deltaproteobacteria bacterium]
MKNILEIFEERGFIEQVTDRDLLWKLTKNPTVCYIGFDPTGSSLHVGSLVPIMALTHMQKAGHTPIALMGGGTTLVGDPSGKTEMRRMMSRKEIEKNAEGIKRQLSRFIDFSPGKALMLNNADWLVDLSYIDFLRDIGRHFSVNRMLTAESYKVRMKTGLSFIEFNYMLLQAYDFWHLFRHYNCSLQMGGNDQWGNILAGVDLIRRLEGEMVHGMTFPLITTSAGIKMGKTHKGSVWLDPELTTPYEYYQYWINQDDRDIARFLALFTFLPMKDIRDLASLKGVEIKKAKEVLAYEATRLCHGADEAEMARNAARLLFGESIEGSSESVPTYSLEPGELEEGIPAYLLFERSGLCRTRGEARRLISQGGAYANDMRIKAYDQILNPNDMVDDTILLRAGKKRYLRITVG